MKEEVTSGGMARFVGAEASAELGVLARGSGSAEFVRIRSKCRGTLRNRTTSAAKPHTFGSGWSTGGGTSRRRASSRRSGRLEGFLHAQKQLARAERLQNDFRNLQLIVDDERVEFEAAGRQQIDRHLM